MLPITDTKPTAGTDRPTLVMSHSFGFSRREWIEVADLLADDYRTVTIDEPGFGDAHDITGYSMTDMAQQFADTIAELTLDRYVLVGHSMSGKLFQILASRAGEHFGLTHPPEGLVLLTPTPLSREVGGEDMRHHLLAATTSRDDAETFVDTHIALPILAEVRERAVQDYQRVNRSAWEAWLNHGVYEDWVERAAPVTVKTLLIAAEQDPVWGPDMQQRLTMPHLANATLKSIDSGHSVPLEAPELLAAMLRDFVGA
jgi:pimeloyl-ACP methyl ester carboxylesterase